MMHDSNEKSTSNLYSFNNIPQILLLLLLRILSFLPLPILYFIGIGVGEIAYWLYGSRRRITKINLTACFPDYSAGKIQQLAHAHFHAMVIGVMVMAISWWCSAKRFQRLIVFRNQAILDELIEKQQNIILLAPHFVTLEFLGICLSSQMRVTTMYQKHKNPYINHFTYQKRTRFGDQIYGSKETMRNLIKTIRSGIPFYYLPDQDPGPKHGVFVPFFEIPTATYPTLNKMTRLGNARVVPCMARLKKWGCGLEIILEKPLENYPSGDDIKDTTNMNKVIEKLIAYAPAQYFWSHRRFKTRPPGMAPFY